jgi:hypothetical protein
MVQGLTRWLGTMPLRLALVAGLAVPAPVAAGVAALEAELRAFAGSGGRELAWVGERIAWNETAGRLEHLTYWAAGEDHASLGIGHFIWYPDGRAGPFRESFPELVAFLEARGVALPAWLTPATPCPWPDREAFRAAHDDPRMIQLRRLLAETTAEQAAFLARRLARALPEILEAAPAEWHATLQERVMRLLRAGDGDLAPGGVYALVDYVNFKGEGTAPGERYGGEGWGLLQVLLAMPEDAADARAAFAEAAAAVLARRVVLAPPERRETRWLDGWLKRVETYRTAGG